MSDKKSDPKRPPILDRFVRREFRDPGADEEEATIELAILDPATEGYDPYNSPTPPPTEGEIKRAMRRSDPLRRR